MVATVSFIGTIGMSFLTASTPMDKLLHFYRTTRPFGWWGPVRAAFSAEEQKELTKEHKNDINLGAVRAALAGDAFPSSDAACDKILQIVLGNAALFLVGLAGLYWFWWRNLPPAEPRGTERQGERTRLADASHSG